MDDKDKDLDSALDDIFESDFMEINTNNSDELLIDQDKETSDKIEKHVNDGIKKDTVLDVQNDTVINIQTQNDEYENKAISKNELNEYVKNGWIKGQYKPNAKSKFKRKCR